MPTPGRSPSVVDHVLENDLHQIELLAAIHDEFEGVIVELSEPLDSGVFDLMLKASITQWKKQGKRGIWIKVPIELINLTEILVKQGFWFHHAEPEYLMLINWLPDGDSPLPANASHRVSIGAFVMNEKREVLVVQEKNGTFRGKGYWKFPTRVLEEGEDVCVAAVREVEEETAVRTEFLEVLAFRQNHKAFFEKSDLFFLCMLRPLSFDIEEHESEIEAAQWMPWEEYVAQPYIQKDDFLKRMCKICLAKKKDENYTGFSPVPTTAGFSGQKNYLYFNVGDFKGSKV